jgi:CheY-like chemotaxis protein
MKTVLVVDDELAITELLRAILEAEGYRVIAAANGLEALATLASADADLVITDLMMPILGGQELCRRLQADRSRAAPPVVLMSAVGEALAGAGLSYQGFLAKPFQIDEVLRVVAALIGKASR